MHIQDGPKKVSHYQELPLNGTEKHYICHQFEYKKSK